MFEDGRELAIENRFEIVQRDGRYRRRRRWCRHRGWRRSTVLASENQRHRNAALIPRAPDTLAVVAERSAVGAGHGRNIETETVAAEHGIAALQAHPVLIQAV